eukprot:maker-scaffold_34-snap-gene-3.15-mRNA-1 protein AED:0.03 eAED:0.03 QI:218/1/1/1/0.75/0.6/5/451/367
MSAVFWICLALTVVGLLACSIILAVLFGRRVISGFEDEDKNCSTVELDREIRSENAYIGLIFLDCPTTSQLQAFVQAQNRWNSIITENKIEPSSVFFSTNIRDYCGFLDNSYYFPFGYEFDHLLIFAEPVAIDGRGGVLAQAAPCAFDDSRFEFPLLGGMQFDTADLDVLDERNTLVDVVTHEMGHVLGLGTLWNSRENSEGDDLLQDAIFRGSNIFPENEPKYVGEAGIEGYEEVGGSGDFVPLEDGKDGDSILLDTENGVGVGSVDVHIKKSVFDDELLTYAIEADRDHPLSIVSIRMLQDLGYEVDENQADDYQLKGQFKGFGTGLDAETGDNEVFVLKGDTNVFDPTMVQSIELRFAQLRGLR